VTETRRWLSARRAELLRRDLAAALLWGAGLVLAVLATGVGLGRIGAFRQAPGLLVAAWGAALVPAWLAARWYRRRRARAAPERLAAQVERSAPLREGSVLGPAEEPQRAGSPGLAALADARIRAWLGDHGEPALRGMRRRSARGVGLGVLAVAAGGLLFGVAGPRAPGSGDFWHPVGFLTRGLGPVTLEADRQEVRPGERVRLEISAPGRASATLWVRAPGEPWSAYPVSLDSAGRGRHVLGPLEADQFVRATSGRRESDTLRIRVSRAAFLADLQLLARYPEYLELPDEPLTVGSDPVAVPLGTRIEASGRASVELAAAAWRSGGVAVGLRAAGPEFAGTLVVSRTARWTLDLVPSGGGTWDEPLPELDIVGVPDSAPIASIPLPGADTTAPLSLRQPMVIDVWDDHLVTWVEVVTRRVSRLGLAEPPAVARVELPQGGADRAVLQWVLDLNGGGYLPGDTAYYRVRAADNRPEPQVGESREYALRLPSAAELRQAMRQASNALARGADSLARAQRDLARTAEELAGERERSEASGRPQGARPGGEDLPFRSAQRAGDVADAQAQVSERARQLAEELRQLSEAAWNAGLTDPAWQEQLRQLEQLLSQAITPEMEEQLRALRAALERLDAEAMREALRQLAERGRELRDELTRSRELFERAAIEGALSTLSGDADELTQRQRDWNRALETRQDSALAAAEERLATETDSLASRLDQLNHAMERAGEATDSVAAAGRRAAQAAQEMRRAADGARRGQRQSAAQAGQRAEQALQPIGSSLQGQQDALQNAWRQEVLATLDHALAETASLARRQMDVAGRMSRGDASGDVRGEQAAIRESVDRVLQRLQRAAGKNALVSPRTGSALGLARLRMNEALERVQRANPNPTDGGELAAQAVDALNAMAYSLLQSSQEVAGSQSGSGLAEALQKLAELAEQQGQMSGQAGGMLSLMPFGGEGLMQELRALAERQRRLGEELDRLGAGGDLGGADELSAEARALAQQLEAGQLDRRTVERQERLFRRLLDAGRTLRGEEEDEEKERSSETARAGNVRLPPALRPPSTGRDLRFPYPDWAQLQGLSPEERRLILDYFRRLNDGRP
jgi:hypothetical protein